MKIRLCKARPWLAAMAGFAASVGCMLAPSDVAVAQAPAPEPVTVVQEVVVYAHVVARKQVGAASTTGAAIEVVSTRRHVSFSDLDLASDKDVGELRNRIKAAAKDACDQLERERPSLVYPPVPPGQDCEKAATEDAMTLALQLTAAAKQAH